MIRDRSGIAKGQAQTLMDFAEQPVSILQRFGDRPKTTYNSPTGGTVVGCVAVPSNGFVWRERSTDVKIEDGKQTESQHLGIWTKDGRTYCFEITDTSEANTDGCLVSQL